MTDTFEISFKSIYLDSYDNLKATSAFFGVKAIPQNY